MLVKYAFARTSLVYTEGIAHAIPTVTTVELSLPVIVVSTVF